jgi:Na+:H+ antiporter, NhaA family
MAGLFLLACTVLAFGLANSPLGPAWLSFWQVSVGGLTLQLWVNDALMALFFLLVGLELEREIYAGELADFRAAMLPIAAAVGGMVVPAAVHFALNAGTPSQPGAGIPMATDIAFAIVALRLAGAAIPASLTVFLTALAVIDDLGAIFVIGLAYTSNLSLPWLAGALGTFGALVAMNRRDVVSLAAYLVGGAVMWFLMLKSGVHPTIAGVLLAFAIPFAPRRGGSTSLSTGLQHAIHRPVIWGVLPVFALANAGVAVPDAWLAEIGSRNSLGILAGLLIGKPIGILLACALAVAAGFCRLPSDLRWSHIAGAGMLAGIGFTMSIFIANLAFPMDRAAVDGSKMAILLASVAAAVLGVAWLRFAAPRAPSP